MVGTVDSLSDTTITVLLKTIFLSGLNCLATRVLCLSFAFVFVFVHYKQTIFRNITSKIAHKKQRTKLLTTYMVNNLHGILTTDWTTVVGSPRYDSPQLIANTDVSERHDRQREYEYEKQHVYFVYFAPKRWMDVPFFDTPESLVLNTNLL